MIAAGLIPNHAEDEEGDDKKPAGSMVTRKRNKNKKDKAKEEESGQVTET
jgi:hypothetical protein